MTLFTVFDVPVFWPILLLYWLMLFTVTMKRQIKHMIKYRYLPFTTGKKVRWQSLPGVRRVCGHARCCDALLQRPVCSG
jgi:Rer1 family